MNAIKDQVPVIDLTISPRKDDPRPWRCRIRFTSGSYHAGEGATPCEALGMAWINWAMTK